MMARAMVSAIEKSGENTIALFSSLTKMLHPLVMQASNITSSSTANPHTIAIQQIKEDEGFSDNDLALMANCIMAHKGLTIMYISLRS